MPSEFDLIARYFTREVRRAHLGVGDDCALMSPSAGHEIALSTDMLVAGRHFFEDVDPRDLVPGDLDAVERRIEEYVALGISKLVLVPLHDPADWRAELEPIAARVQPLQT